LGVAERKASGTAERTHGNDRVPPNIFKAGATASVEGKRSEDEDRQLLHAVA
jgi:hypothetical protein